MLLFRMKKINIFICIVVLLPAILVGCTSHGSIWRKPGAKNTRSSNKNRYNSESFSWKSDRNEVPYEIDGSDEPVSERKKQSRYRYKKTSNRSVYNPVKTQAAYGASPKYVKTKKIYTRKKNKSAFRKKRRYRIRKGDTLYSISRKYNVSLNKLCSVNRLSKRSRIKTGSYLIIPASGGYVSRKKSTWKKNKKYTHKRKYKAASQKKYYKNKSKLKFIWPVKGIKKVTQDNVKGVKSLGILITGRPGASVVSSAPGTVKKVGFMRGFGNFIMIVHKDRYITVYSNLDMVNVTEGDRVAPGKSIGRLDNRRNNLHFQINHAGKNRNPIPLLPKRRF